MIIVTFNYLFFCSFLSVFFSSVQQEVAESEKTIADGDTVLQQSEPAVDGLL